MQRSLVYLIITGLMFLLPANLFADTYSETVDFIPTQAYSWNNFWPHNLSNIPAGCDISSAEIKVRAKVYSWGYYPYEQDILASDTTNFNYSSGFICTLDTSTHPRSDRFYTITCSLTAEQLDWIANYNQINFMMVTFGGTYYLEYSTLEVDCSAPPSQVVTPTFNPIPGSYDSAQTVEISTTTPSTTIYYTTNGDDPTESDSQYTDSIDIEETTTLKTRAYRSGWTPSEIASGLFTINIVETPAFSPAPGTYTSVQSVEISCSTPDATIHFTTNGDDPTESSAEFTQPVDIDDTMTLKARAYKDGWGDSEIAVGEYTINLSEINIVPWITPLLFP